VAAVRGELRYWLELARLLAVHSRSDGIVDWRACLDPHADCVEVEGSHIGMAVNPSVYRELESLLDRTEVATSSR
jgi:triacylglycerol lipase